MNEHTSNQSHLGRLLDEATAHYNPQPDTVRFERMLQTQHRRRAGMIVWSAAACFALIGGTAFAFNQTPDDHKLSPANSSEQTDSTEKVTKTTVYRPDKTVPDGGHDPIDKVPPVATEPKDETSTTEKKKDKPTTTEPKTTEPKDETTTTDGEESTWSVHQLYGSCDTEPPFDVFWGTANIGDKIKIESDYGTVKVFADDEGNWEAHITFTNPPVGVAFEVWVHAPYHDEVFWFTYLG